MVYKKYFWKALGIWALSSLIKCPTALPDPPEHVDLG